MTRLIRCPCGQVLKVPVDQVGRPVQCPRCSKAVAVPAAASPAARPVERPQPAPTPPPSASRSPFAPPPVMINPAFRPGSAPGNSTGPAPPPHPTRRPGGSRPPNWGLIGVFGGLASGLAVVLVWVVARSTASPRVTPEPPASVGAASRSTTGAKIAAHRPSTTREIVSRSVASIALVKGRMSSGTGFMAAPGILATNHHVVENELIPNVSVTFGAAPGSERGPFAVKLLFDDAHRDLALLRLSSLLPPLDLAQNYVLERGENITIIGNPGSLGGAITLENAITQGVLSTEATIGGQRYFQLGASVNPGNSGGPALDSEGRVIGIVTLKARLEEGHSFCIPVFDLIRVLDRVDSITHTQIARVESRHTAQSTFQVVGNMAVLYINAGAKLVTVAEAKAKAKDGKAPDEVFEAFTTAKTKALDYYGSNHQDYFAALQQVLDDPATDTQVAKDLREYRKLVDRLKDQVEHPEGKAPEYEAKLVENAKSYKTLSERLSSALDVSR